MNTFASAVINQSARTENNMLARDNTGNACTDFFFKAGASRNQDIIPNLVAALVENEEIASRIILWARDIRGGAGERQTFRNILRYLETYYPHICEKILPKIQEIGRWDDGFSLQTVTMREKYFELIKIALEQKNGLCAKWCDRKGINAIELRNYLGWSPKHYRKTLVELTKVVEQKMASNLWDEINFSQVPSVASSRYKKAFNRHTEKYAEYVAALVKGDTSVKVNASAIFPHDVIKGVSTYGNQYDKAELDLIIKQWESLPNFVGDSSILPLVDVSGSMTCIAGKKGTTTCLDVAVSLGLYLAEKNKGKFKDTFLTFSRNPQLLHLKGNIVEKISQMSRADWEMNTNLHLALDKIFSTAIEGNVPQEEMPKMLIILSDMQFDQCVMNGNDKSAIEMIRTKYENHDYKMPNIVFWNLNSHNNVPVKFNEQGVALISGFSPAIMKSVLSSNMDELTPYGIMMKAISDPKYSLIDC